MVGVLEEDWIVGVVWYVEVVVVVLFDECLGFVFFCFFVFDEFDDVWVIGVEDDYFGGMLCVVVVFYDFSKGVVVVYEWDWFGWGVVVWEWFFGVV